MGKRKRIDGYTIPVLESPVVERKGRVGLRWLLLLVVLAVVVIVAAWLAFTVAQAQDQEGRGGREGRGDQGLGDQAPTVDLHIRVTDGQGPVAGMVRLEWADTGGTFEVGPTSDVVLPVPADGDRSTGLTAGPFTLTVSAPGYAAWSQVMTPTKGIDLVVRLVEE